MSQAHLFISGFVQGVGFRQFIKQNAQKLGITGWVENMPDRRVEAVFQGRREDIKQMVLFCGKGPFLAEVKDVEVIWSESQETFENFEIKH